MTAEDGWKDEGAILAHEARRLSVKLRTQDVAVVQDALRELGKERGESVWAIAAAVDLIAAPDFFAEVDVPNREAVAAALDGPLDLDNILKS